jgi:hypothetical protein
MRGETVGDQPERNRASSFALHARQVSFRPWVKAICASATAANRVPGGAPPTVQPRSQSVPRQSHLWLCHTPDACLVQISDALCRLPRRRRIRQNRAWHTERPSRPASPWTIKHRTKWTVSDPGKVRKVSAPDIGALMRYRDRTVRVVAEASGQRAIIESSDETGRMFRSTVKWANLMTLADQLF